MQELTTTQFYESRYNATLKAEFGHLELRHILPSTVQGWTPRAQRDAQILARHADPRTTEH